MVLRRILPFKPPNFDVSRETFILCLKNIENHVQRAYDERNSHYLIKQKYKSVLFHVKHLN